MPTNCRPNRAQATPVVPLPQNGSSTKSPGRDAARITRSSNASGLCVGCFPCRFSHAPGGFIFHNEVIWLLESKAALNEVYGERCDSPFSLWLIIDIVQFVAPSTPDPDCFEIMKTIYSEDCR